MSDEEFNRASYVRSVEFKPPSAIAVEFMDRFAATVELEALGISDANPETVRKYALGGAIEYRTKAGKWVTYDSAVLRAHADEPFWTELEQRVSP